MAGKPSWVVGHHAVSAVLSVSPERALELCVVMSKHPGLQEIVTRAQSLGIAVSVLDKPAVSKRCASEQHQGVALLARSARERSEKELKAFAEALDSPFLLILDQVQDPHNFGACLRTADAAGVDAVIVAKDNASPMTATVQKVASGAAETMPIFRVSNLARSMQTLKELGIWVIGTSDRAQGDLYQQDLSGSIAIVMGAEGKGMRSLTEKNCDLLISMPMAGTVVSSLNVSVATGVCLYEAVRQRSKSKTS